VISQVPAVPGRDLADGLIEDFDVIGRGVGPGAALTQPQRQRLAGVVTPGHQGMVTPGALIRFCCQFLVRVGDHDRGVHPDHDGLAQIAVGHPGRWDRPVAFLD
jgi:hypothetical protein